MKSTIPTLFIPTLPIQFALALLAITFSSIVLSEEVPKAELADRLTATAKSAQQLDAKTNQQREKVFLANKNQQAQLLREAEVALAKEEKRSEQLEKIFSENEKQVESVHAKLLEALGALKEIFGHLTAAAGDTRGQFSTSVVDAQFPQRESFLNQIIKDMESDTQLPSAEQIEMLWQSMQNEMRASGNVSSFSREIIKPNGEIENAQVLRIGNFNLLANNRYLSFSTEQNTVSELARQPSAANKQVENLSSLSEQEYGVFSLDPTGPLGGSYLQALIASPSLFERWQQGGIIGYVITLLGLLAAILAAWRFVLLNKQQQGVVLQVAAWKNEGKILSDGNALACVLTVYQKDTTVDVETLERRLGEAILAERPSIERYLSSLKIVSMVAPLLGLLGTVSGMIITFQAITIFGAGDPKAMAGGISSALVTTVLGLCVAIPAVFIHSALSAKANQILHILKQQSAGLIAVSSESAQGSQEK